MLFATAVDSVNSMLHASPRKGSRLTLDAKFWRGCVPPYSETWSFVIISTKLWKLFFDKVYRVLDPRTLKTLRVVVSRVYKVPGKLWKPCSAEFPEFRNPKLCKNRFPEFSRNTANLDTRLAMARRFFARQCDDAPSIKSSVGGLRILVSFFRS